MTQQSRSIYPTPRTPVPQTEWSVILCAGSDGPNARAALASFCRAYEPVAYEFFRRCRNDPERARDLTQGFFLGLIARKDLKAVRPGGRFRSWFYHALKSALYEDWRSATCAKRDFRKTASLEAAMEVDGEQVGPIEVATPEWEFDHAWALALLDRAMAALESEETRAGRGADFLAVKSFLPQRDMLDPDYAPVEAEHGMPRGSLRFKVCKLKTRYHRALNEEITRTVEEADVADEWRHLHAALQRPRPKP